MQRRLARFTKFSYPWLALDALPTREQLANGAMDKARANFTVTPRPRGRLHGPFIYRGPKSVYKGGGLPFFPTQDQLYPCKLNIFE
eukprot:9487287-Pyramimonas_sp.AAC.2